MPAHIQCLCVTSLLVKGDDALPVGAIGGRSDMTGAAMGKRGMIGHKEKRD